MKQSFSIVMLGIAVAAIAHVSAISWKSMSLDLGEIKVGEVQELSFEFTNEGTKAIRILEAKGSCGCTVVDFPKSEIIPGESGKVSANFKSSKPGQFRKSVKVKTTASEEYIHLSFSGVAIE